MPTKAFLANHYVLSPLDPIFPQLVGAPLLRVDRLQSRMCLQVEGPIADE